MTCLLKEYGLLVAMSMAVLATWYVRSQKQGFHRVFRLYSSTTYCKLMRPFSTYCNFISPNGQKTHGLRTSWVVDIAANLHELMSSNILLEFFRQWFVHPLEVDRRLSQEDQHCLQIDIQLEFHSHSIAATINRLVHILVQ